MKKILLFGIMILGVLALNAQTDKGDWMVGGNLSFNTAKKNTSIQFSPQAGYFFAKNFVLGGQLSVAYNEQGNTNITDFGVGPFVRYYFGETKARPFFTGDMNFLSSHVKTEIGSANTTAFEYFLGGGASFFINDNVAVDGILGYRHAKYKDVEGSGGLNLRIGFQVFLSRRQVSKLRGQ
jgi:hypothetical protein